MPAVSEQAWVLADDATGALEAGAIIASRGCSCRVHMLPVQEIRSDALVRVIHTETRHLEPARAADVVRDALFRSAGISWFYKKTDSTLRGPIGAELAAMIRAYPGRPLVYVPAYPQMGRTVRAGELLIRGVPVAQTEFSRDLLGPVQSSVVADHLRPQYQGPIAGAANARELREHLYAIREGIVICDAESEDHLIEIARELRLSGNEFLTAGPSGFISHWAGLIGLPSEDPAPLPRARTFLVVCGSLHPASRAQANHARECGAEVLSSPSTTGDPAAAADVLARRAAERITARAVDAVIVFGGDTMAALCRQLGWATLLPLAELLPGISASVPEGESIMVIAKAGGFGAVDVFSRIRERVWE